MKFSLKKYSEKVFIINESSIDDSIELDSTVEHC